MGLLTCRQLQEWMEFASIEPIGEYRSELRHGQMMRLLHNAHFQGGKQLKPIDFMNFVEKPPEKELTVEERMALIDKEVFGL